MVSLSVSLPQLQLFFLVFLRTGAFLMSLPVINAPSVPVLFRIGLGLSASLLLVPSLPPFGLPYLADGASLGVAAAGEVLLGLLAGMAVRLVFEGLQLAGQIAGYQMGMAIAEVIDPASEDQVALLSQFNTLLATLIFLAINGHHAFIRSLVESYAIVPPMGFQIQGPVMERLARLSAEVFVIGLKAGAPIIVALMLSTVSFGLVARTVPQMNIFIVSLPLNIGVGLLFIGLSLPHLAGYIGDLFGATARSALLLLRAVP
ncbi:MAG: flagellar biosynthetic protein FliR [Desulfobacterales bacterium]